MHKKNQVSPEVSCPADGWKEDDGLSTISLENSTASIEEDGGQHVRIVNPNTVTTQHNRHNSQHFSVSEESANTRTAPSPSAQIKDNNVTVRQESDDLLQYFLRLSETDADFDLAYIETLLSNGVDINSVDESNGATIMHMVARSWDVTVAQFLYEKGINICRADHTGKTPLHVAASSNHHDMVEWLISQGADVEARTIIQRQTPVHHAARNDSVLSLEVLIQNGGNYETKDYKGRTPLHLAAELDRTIVANFLVSLDIPANCMVTDDAGSHVITSMIRTMPKVAVQSLDQLRKLAPAERKQYYMLSNLEHGPGHKHTAKAIKSPFEMAVEEGRYEILTHTVMEELVKQKWKHVRWYYYTYLGLYFLFLISWSILIAFPSVQLKHIYAFPTDIWRIVLEIIAVGTYLHQIGEEVAEIIRSNLKHRRYTSFRQRTLQDDLKNTDFCLPEERKYLMYELERIKKSHPNYFKDPWNILDLITYVALLLLIALHLTDIVAHSTELAKWTARFSCVAVLLIWVRLLKLVRALRALGPLIAIIGELIADILRYFTLYSVFVIPYLISAWVLFGGDQSVGAVDNEDFTVFYRVAVVIFRMSLIDSFPYETMRDIDELMATILVTSFLFTIAVVGLNLFIALLSDTFQRVYDNSQANALLEQAKIVLQLEDKVHSYTYHRYLTHIQNNCNPYSCFYDDDDDSERPTQLQKLTHQIHEMVTELQRERKEMEGSFRLHSLIDKAEETDSRLLQISVQIQEIKDTLCTMISPAHPLLKTANTDPDASRANAKYCQQSRPFIQEQPRKLVPIQPFHRGTSTRYKVSSNGHAQAAARISTVKQKRSMKTIWVQ